MIKLHIVIRILSGAIGIGLIYIGAVSVGFVGETWSISMICLGIIFNIIYIISSDEYLK